MNQKVMILCYVNGDYRAWPAAGWSGASPICLAGIQRVARMAVALVYSWETVVSLQCKPPINLELHLLIHHGDGVMEFHPGYRVVNLRYE